jgi:hypothetical protein
MNVTTAELRQLCNQLLTHLESNGIHTISVTDDYYWNVPSDQRYNPYEQPGQPDLGQLSDDIRELRRTLEGEREPVAYALVWLSSLLRYVGEKTVS